MSRSRHSTAPETMRRLVDGLESLWEAVVSVVPGPLGHRLRRLYWRSKLGGIGTGVIIDVQVRFEHPESVFLDDNSWIDRNVLVIAGPPGGSRLTHERENPHYRGRTGEVRIGKNVHVAPNCVLSGMGGLQIGDNVGIASGSTIYSFSHHYRDGTDRTSDKQYSFTPLARPDQQSMILGPVVLGDYSAVGLQCVVLPGTTVHEGAWIASGSVVTNDVEAQTVRLSDGSSRDLSHLTIIK